MKGEKMNFNNAFGFPKDQITIVDAIKFQIIIVIVISVIKIDV